MCRYAKSGYFKEIALPREAREVVEAIAAAGGQALLVGGFVRDLIMGLAPKDLDIEVHGLELERLEAVLGRFGVVDLVGKQFGVLRLHGLDADWSVPRRDSAGRHPTIVPDPHMGIEEAARRRDLTVNAMAADPLDGTLYDPFDGQGDLGRKVLRAPDAARFVEDPLRFYRVMAFAGRLEMTPDAELCALCRDMDLGDVARERIEEEFAKLFLKGVRPSIGLRWIQSIGRLGEILPEVAPLVGLEQEPRWHPEGDVWRHTLQTVDAAAQLRSGDREEDLMLMWSALCHDLGKAGTTEFSNGRIRSPGHAELSAELTKRLMGRIVGNHQVLKGAIKLSAHHLKPHDFAANKATARGFKRLALALAPETNLLHVATLALADYRGRNPDSDEPLDIRSEECEWFIEQAENLRVQHEPEKPVLMGRHLLDVMKPGPAMGVVLRKAYEIQLGEGVKDVEELKRRVMGDG